jgi:hypothetical protein
VGTLQDAEHAARIHAAWLLGKQFNPDHDETDYLEQTRRKRRAPAPLTD